MHHIYQNKLLHLRNNEAIPAGINTTFTFISQDVMSYQHVLLAVLCGFT